VLPGHISVQTGQPVGTDGPAGAVHHQGEDHLPQLGAEIFRVAVFAQALAALAFERQTGRVHKGHREIGEQVATALEQPLLDLVLDATRRRRSRCLFDGLAEPRHRPIEVVQGERRTVGQRVIGHPRGAIAIGTRDKQAVQGGNEDGALNRKAKAAPGQQPGQHLADAEFLPKTAKQQWPADPLGIERQAAVVGFQRLQQQHLIGEPGTRGDEASQGAGGDQRLGAAEIGDHRLPDAAGNASVLDDLEIAAPARLLDPEEHRSPRNGALRYHPPITQQSQ
jgi:hypothetical protein